jgi:hypothetical protein
MDSELKTIFALRPFKWALICSIWMTRTRVMLVKVIFFGKGPGQGQIPELHGPQIPDHTIGHCKATDSCSKFQLSRCYRLRNRTDGRTDGRTDDTTISVEPIFLKCALKILNLSMQFHTSSKACSCNIKALKLVRRWTWTHFWPFLKKISSFFRKAPQRIPKNPKSEYAMGLFPQKNVFVFLCLFDSY